jgi:hypothetical protein
MAFFERMLKLTPPGSTEAPNGDGEPRPGVGRGRAVVLVVRA